MNRRAFLKLLGEAAGGIMLPGVSFPTALSRGCKHCGRPFRLTSFSGHPVWEHTPHRGPWPNTLCRYVGTGTHATPHFHVPDKDSYDRLRERLTVKAQQGYEIESFAIDTPERISGEMFRFVRLYCKGERSPFTWWEKY